MRHRLPLIALLICLATSELRAADAPKFELRADDVVALLGGEPTVLEGERGHLESLLIASAADKHVRFRNLAWEGDTAFEQPRDVNFPDTIEQLKRAGATVVVCRFGQYESLAGTDGLPAFVSAYEALCDRVEKQLGSRRIVMISPAPFGKPVDALLPDHSVRNDDVQRYAEAVSALADRRGYAFVNLFAKADGVAPRTENGVRPTPTQTGREAISIVRSLGLPVAADLSADEAGRWSSTGLEALRRAVIAKNKLWFDYARPMNWAFLGGDRVQVQASRDHRDPNVRWFPAEIQQFVPLIDAADKAVGEAAEKASAVGRNQ